MKPQQLVADIEQRHGGPAQFDQLTFQLIQILQMFRAGFVREQIAFESLETRLQIVHDRTVIIDHEIHDRIQHITRASRQALGRRFAALAHFGVTLGGAVAHRHDKVDAEKNVGLAEYHIAVQQLCSLQYQKQVVAILFQLRALMRRIRIFHGQIVQTEFILQFLDQRRVRFQQADPDKPAFARQFVADLVDGDVAQFDAVFINRAIDDHICGVQEPSPYFYPMALGRKDYTRFLRPLNGCFNVCASSTPNSVMPPPTDTR